VLFTLIRSFIKSQHHPDIPKKPIPQSSLGAFSPCQVFLQQLLKVSDRSFGTQTSRDAAGAQRRTKAKLYTVSSDFRGTGAAGEYHGKIQYIII
jgi:hypothetical protein